MPTKILSSRTNKRILPAHAIRNKRFMLVLSDKNLYQSKVTIFNPDPCIKRMHCIHPGCVCFYHDDDLVSCTGFTVTFKCDEINVEDYNILTELINKDHNIWSISVYNLKNKDTSYLSRTYSNKRSISESFISDTSITLYVDQHDWDYDIFTSTTDGQYHTPIEL